MSANANAFDARNEPPNLEPLVAALLARAPRMNFMQLCRLLEVRVRRHPGFGTSDTPAHERVRFRPRARTGFPGGERRMIRALVGHPHRDGGVSVRSFSCTLTETGRSGRTVSRVMIVSA